ncbi:hypothetical protein T484DRAFT_1797873, partial [Baffinella frigidus]
VSSGVSTSRRGGGGAALAFDQDPSTFWDADAAGQDKWLQYHLSACEIGGGRVGSYEFVTASSGGGSGCPANWTLLGSDDAFEWTEIDSRKGVSCTPGGAAYTSRFFVFKGVSYTPSAAAYTVASPGYYKYYRWVFTGDQDGHNGKS